MLLLQSPHVIVLCVQYWPCFSSAAATSEDTLNLCILVCILPPGVPWTGCHIHNEQGQHAGHPDKQVLLGTQAMSPMAQTMLQGHCSAAKTLLIRHKGALQVRSVWST